MAQFLRDATGKPIDVNSGCRCEKHNRAEGGSDVSQHLLKDGLTHAGDFSSNYTSPEEMYNILDKAFPNSLGLGIYPWGIHVDDRMDRAYRWVG